MEIVYGRCSLQRCAIVDSEFDLGTFGGCRQCETAMSPSTAAARSEALGIVESQCSEHLRVSLCLRWPWETKSAVGAPRWCGGSGEGEGNLDRRWGAWRGSGLLGARVPTRSMPDEAEPDHLGIFARVL